MRLPRYSQVKLGLLLATGVIVAAVLSVQCVRTYWYIEAVLVPQQAEREAERQAGAVAAAARSAAITDAHALRPVLERALETAGERVLWMRVLDPASDLLAQAGAPQGTARVPARWFERLGAHESGGTVVDTPAGPALVAMLPLRLAHPPHAAEMPGGQAGPHPPGALVIELAIPLKAVANAFAELRRNLIVGVIASIALLLSMAVIGFRMPQYLRGRYLESELQLARRVQNDLRPKAQLVSQRIEFGAAAVAADQVGGDFYDFFEGESGRVSFVLGDVSGKGVPAALLVSVLQGAIRSSTAVKHEHACEQINRMLCERTACERFATLFWGVFDPITSTLRYVNAGHAAPMLMRHDTREIERLTDGGPVLGMLPRAGYSAGTIKIESSDMLILYSDGIDEATNKDGLEFGEGGVQKLLADPSEAGAAEICERIMSQVSAFAGAGTPQDDRTLLVVRFPELVPPAKIQQEVLAGAVA